MRERTEFRYRHPLRRVETYQLRHSVALLFVLLHITLRHGLYSFSTRSLLKTKFLYVFPHDFHTMDQRIEVDPGRILCPNFAEPTYDFLRRALIADQTLIDVGNDGDATQKLKDNWTAENTRQRAAFQAQSEADAAREEQLRQQAAQAQREAEEAERAKHREAAKEAEAKKTPARDYQDGVGLQTFVENTHPYAIKQITDQKFVEYWYFLPIASQEATNQLLHNADTNQYHLATSDGANGTVSMSLVGTHSTKPSRNAIPDTLLTWHQVLSGKTVFLQTILLGYRQKDFMSFARFYAVMETHPELRSNPDGEQVMAQYHAMMRQQWYAAMRNGNPFDISVLSEDVMNKCRHIVQQKAQQSALSGEVPVHSEPPHSANHILFSPLTSAPQLPPTRHDATNDRYTLLCPGHASLHHRHVLTCTPRYDCYATLWLSCTPCYSTSCHATLQYATSRYATSCYATLCYATLPLDMPHHSSARSSSKNQCRFFFEHRLRIQSLKLWSQPFPFKAATQHLYPLQCNFRSIWVAKETGRQWKQRQQQVLSREKESCRKDLSPMP